jgi:hypothetical protein
MKKSFAGFLSIGCGLASCAAPPQPAALQASAGQTAVDSSINTAPAESDDDYETMWVAPPVGSMLGGGTIRVARRKVTGNDESALLGHIRHLDAAASTKVERPFVVAAVSQVTGLTQDELLAQQDRLQLRFGELCAINAIAAGHTNKVREIAALKSKGKTWTEVAATNGLSIATVAETARNASELTVASYSNSAERAKGGEKKLKAIGVKIQSIERPDAPAHPVRRNPVP